MHKKHQTRYLRKVLANLARNDPKTKEVVLNGFAIGNEHDKMAQLAMSIVSNHHIQILCLNNCDITSKGAHLLAYAIGKNRSLEHVWLNGNKIGSSGAEAIATAATKNKTLVTVGLSNNSVGNHGGRALIKTLRQNHNITDIFVDGNRMSHKVEDEINRICYGEESDDDEDETEAYHLSSCNHSASRRPYDDYDNGTVTGSIVSRYSTSFVTKALSSIKEAEYESESDSDDDSSTASVMSDDAMDFDFTCFYQKKKESKLSKLKARFTRRKTNKKVKPGNYAD
jgi:hypothetical protein